ncbi:MAG: M23 family metallopeptidase [Myxococcota bacterium]
MNPVDLAGVSFSALSSAPRPSEEASTSMVFAQILVKELRSALPEGGWLGGGPFASFETLLDEQFATVLAEQLEGLIEPPPHGEGMALPSRGLPDAVLPVRDGRLTSAFGMRTDPIDGAHRHHDGIDLAAPKGSPIRVVRAGRVTRAHEVPGYGRLVVVDHGRGLETRYAHCDDIHVAVGDDVAAGTVLGTVGSTGRSTGPHLHFEVRQDGTPIDPVATGLVDPRD